MTLSDLASIGSLVSGIAVLVSLVYLALQMRQTHRNQKALMNQGTVTRNVDILMFHSQPHINALTTRVAAGETQFTAEEISYLHMRLRTTMLTAQDTYMQHQAGLVDQITLDNSNAVLRSVLSQPVYRALWKISRRAYAPEWAAHVNASIEGVPLAHPSDGVGAYKAALTEITGAEGEK